MIDTHSAAALESLRAVRQQVSTFAGEPFLENDLPAAIQDLLDQYRAEHPGASIVPVRWIATSPAGQTTRGEGDLPGLGEMLTLAVTATVIEAGRAQVHSDVLLLAIGSTDEGRQS